MKTSPELLSDILGVLGSMSAKMDAAAAASASAPKPKGDTNIKLGAIGVLGSLLGKKGAAAKMAEDVEKLKTAMKGFNLVRLNQMIESMEKYAKTSKEIGSAAKASGWAQAGKDMGEALMYIAGGILSFAGIMAISSGLLGINPAVVIGYIVLSTLALAKTMQIISGNGDEKGMEKSAAAIENGKNMGIAFMYIAGGILSFGVALAGAGALLGVPTLLAPVAVAGVIMLMAYTMVGLATLTAQGDEKMNKGKPKTGKNAGKGTKGAIDNAKDMGIAFMFIAGGVLAFAISIALVPKILGLGSGGGMGAIVGVLAVAGIIGVMVGIIALIGLAERFIQPGINVAKGIGIALLVLSAGVFVVALTSKMLLEMFRGSKTVTDAQGNKTKEKGGPMAAIGNAAAGIGIFGLFVASLGALLWVLGLPVISGPIALGSLALIGMAFGLIMTAVAIKKVTETMKEVGDMKKVSENIRLMVSGVMSGVIAGVMGKAEATSLKDIDISIKDVRQFRRVTKIIKMLGKISNSLGKFAEGLRAFAKVGEIASLDYEYNEDGTINKPKIGDKPIHVKAIAQSIADTFGLFLKTLVKSTEGMTRREARSLKILGKALTGDRGLISGVSQFALVLKTFSEFGAKGEIYVPAIKDENGKIVKEAENVPITTITQNIVDSFGKFVEAMAAKAPLFELGGVLGKKMSRFSEALMGTEKGFLKRAKPGILSAITSFNDVLLTYSEYGAGGKIPKKNKDGEIIPDQYIFVETIANNMVDGITTFVSSLNRALTGKDLESSSKAIEKQISSFTDIISNFDKLAESQEGMEKLATSMGLLATNIGLLVNNMSGLSTEKLNSLATITAQHAVTTKGVAISDKSATATANASSASQPDWDKIADRIGQTIAKQLVGTQPKSVNFRFIDWPQGQMEYTQ